jgi:flavodoxin
VVRSAATASGEVKSVSAAKAKNPGGKVLIVYFSQTGNTDGLAKIIHEITGYDIVRIERATPYSATYNSQGLYAEALTEYRNQAVPELKAYVPNLADYDVILLGYCNWWASIPAPVRSFLMHDDFSGKTIVPFCSMGGGRFGQTISAIAKLAPESVILKGLDVTYSSYDRTAIRAWLDGITAYQQTSSISTVKSDSFSNKVFYSLNGQKVTEPRKGIYVVGGEKRIFE